MTRMSHDDVILFVFVWMIELLRILQQLYMGSRRHTETTTIETTTKPYLIDYYND